MVARTSCVREVLLNVEFRLMIKQAIQHVRSLALGGADRQDAEVSVLGGQMAVELRTGFATVMQVDVTAQSCAIAGFKELTMRGGRGPIAP